MFSWYRESTALSAGTEILEFTCMNPGMIRWFKAKPCAGSWAELSDVLKK